MEEAVFSSTGPRCKPYRYPNSGDLYMIKLLCLGDVVSRAGVEALENGGMKKLREKYTPDLVVVNGENAAEGNGRYR